MQQLHNLYKLHVFREIRKYLRLDKGNPLIDSQFSFVPLTQMFFYKAFHRTVQKVHHKTLKVVY